MHIPRNIALTYRNAKDKRQAIHDILNIQDARAFYEASGVRPERLGTSERLGLRFHEVSITLNHPAIVWLLLENRQNMT
jgi:hypothetical protein